jgi:DNA modification methylase/ParB-like chromosome segregation protein Spo0J
MKMQRVELGNVSSTRANLVARLSINIDDIKIKKRIRKDLGDIASLAANINELGLLQPIAINENNELICGYRRILAFKKLQRKQIPCLKVNLASLAKGEFSENAFRKDFTFSEMVEIKSVLEPEIKREADIRMKAGKPMPKLGKGRSTEIIAKALGIGHTSLEKVEKLVDAAEKRPELRKLLDKVDNGKVSLDRAYKQIVKHEKLQEFLQTPVNSITDDSIRLIEGDVQNESLQVPDNSVHLIFTDPPYDEKSLHLYEALALHGERVLKPDGSLVTYAGHYAIPQIIQYMETRNLHYYWIFAVVHTGPFSSFFAKNILVKWKPLLWFVKGESEKPYQNSKIFDLINSARPDKILHGWEQASEEARYIIDQLTKPGDTVFDPFMGSGTTGIAAIKLKRKFVGIEIDKGVLEVANRNLSSVQSFLEISFKQKGNPSN